MENKKTFAIIGMVLGIVTIIACWIPYASFFAIATGIAGIILSVIGKKQLQASGEKAAMAPVGLVLSIVGLVFGIIMSIVYCSCICAAAALSEAAENGSLDSALSALGEDLGSDVVGELTSALS